MGKHTPEPWAVHQDASGDVFISSAVTSFHIAEVGSEDDETVFADANRIVACVNFCAGISTENLEENEKLLWLAKQYNEVKSQREALQTVIDELLDRGLFFSSAIESGDDDIDFKDWESRARAATAKTQGGDA